MNLKSRIFSSAGVFLLLFACFLFSPSAHAATYTVDTLAGDQDNSCGDEDCSVRDAVYEANNNSGSDTINFSVSGTINLGNTLEINEGVTLDGGDNITLDGTSIPGGQDIIFVSDTGDGATIKDIALDNSPNNGIQINGDVDTVTIQSCVIGGSTGTGILIAGDGAGSNDDPRNITIKGNMIGTNSTATAANGNGASGIWIWNVDLTSDGSDPIKIGTSNVNDFNIISGNDGWGGIFVSDSSFDEDELLIQNAAVGTNLTGTSAIPNSDSGITLSNVTRATIGGDNTANEENVISGNGSPPLGDTDGSGISINTSSYIKIYGNHIGNSAQGDIAIPNEEHGIEIDSSTSYVYIGSTSGSEYGNVISGNGDSSCDGNCHGIEVQDSSNIYAYYNIVGLEADKSDTLANDGIGIYFDGVTGAAVVGSTSAPNYVGGNADVGIQMESMSTNFSIAGNYIGTSNGTTEYGNSSMGIFVSGCLNASNAIASNTIQYNNALGIFMMGSHSSITSNTISDNASLGVAGIANASSPDPDNPATFSTAPSISGNTIQNNAAIGIFLVDYVPSNISSLYDDNTLSGNASTQGNIQVNVSYFGAVEVIDEDGNNVTSANPPTSLTLTDNQSNVTTLIPDQNTANPNFAGFGEDCDGSIDACADVVDETVCGMAGCTWGGSSCSGTWGAGTLDCYQTLTQSLGQPVSACNDYFSTSACTYTAATEGIWGDDNFLGFAAFSYNNILSWPIFTDFTIDDDENTTEYNPYAIAITGASAETGSSTFSFDGDSNTDPVGCNYDNGTLPFQQGGRYQIAQVNYGETDISLCEEGIDTTLSVGNEGPLGIRTGSDGGSDATTPTDEGDPISFTVTASDINGDQYYLAVCKTDAVTAGNDTFPTCDGGDWMDDDPTATNSGSQASATYTTTGSETCGQSCAWYMFVCDKVSGGGICMPPNGYGEQGSATGTITFADVPADGASVTYGGDIFEFDTEDGVSCSGGEDVCIDATDAEDGQDMAALMQINQTLTSTIGDDRGNVFYIYANHSNIGAAGNSIALSKSGDTYNDITLSGSSLDNGAGGDVTDAQASPFKVNHRPSIGTVNIGDSTGGTGSVEPGEDVYFNVVVTDGDTDTSPDTIDMHVCLTNSFTEGSGCDANQTICSTTGNSSGGNAECDSGDLSGDLLSTYNPSSTTSGTKTVYIFLEDSHDLRDVGTDNTQTYDVTNTAPTVSSVTLTDTMNPAAGGSDTITWTAVINDDNGED
ncbi:hypothetical protein JW752_02140, partial [Candidatus Peregrinibacteria bacterium]|nr:hypothetical protein [Candidatus Peregrinibacteria bacterium]